MKTLINVAFGAVLVFGSAFWLAAQADKPRARPTRAENPNAKTTAPASDSVSSQSRTDHTLSQNFDSVVRAEDLIGREPKGMPGQLGKVDDLLIDLETSQVVAAVFRQHLNGRTAAMVTLPIVALRSSAKGYDAQPWVTDAIIQQIEPLAEATAPITRGWVSAQYRSLKRDPYWMARTQQQTVGGRIGPRKFDQEDYLLAKYSELIGLGVVDAAEKPVGQIESVVVELNSFDVAYVLVKSASSKHLAVPLGVFEISPGKPWQIELDREVIRSRSITLDGDLPRSIDRGWLEYIAVRYGRTGVQEKSQSE